MTIIDSMSPIARSRHIELPSHLQTEPTTAAHPLAGMRIAAAQDWVEVAGGAEKVLDELLSLSDDTDLYCLWNNGNTTNADRIRESWLARSPLRDKKAPSLPLMSRTWRSLKPTREYDVALISSCAFAHHARLAPSERTFVYAHSPARYIWDRAQDPRGRGAAAGLVPYMMRIDRKYVHREGHYAANSEYVADRIRRAWRLEPKVIYPPVDVDTIRGVSDWTELLSEADSRTLERLPETFLLGASRLVTYKAIDRVIAAGAASGLPIVIAGDGPDRPRLETLAAAENVPVFFLGRVTDELLFALYQRAYAYVFPAVEDFGIMPVEAMAAGAKVVGNRVGGAAETVTDGVSGVLVDPTDTSELVLALDRVQTVDRRTASEAAVRFNRERFVEEVASWISTHA